MVGVAVVGDAAVAALSSYSCVEAAVTGAVVSGTVGIGAEVIGAVVVDGFAVPATLCCTARPAPSPTNAATLNTAVFWRAPRAGCRRGRGGVRVFITPLASCSFVSVGARLRKEYVRS
jgi:hypothetical protein